jgi:Fungal hydrophobin
MLNCLTNSLFYIQFSSLAAIFVFAAAASAQSSASTASTSAAALPQSAITYILEQTGVDLNNKHDLKPIQLKMETVQKRQGASGDVVNVNGNCSQGKVQCCNSIMSGQKAKTVSSLLDLDEFIGDVGINCVQLPVNVIGVSGAISNQCKSTPVCCQNVTQNGLINLGCNALPIN